MSTSVLNAPKERIDLDRLKAKVVNLVLLGKGNVGSNLIDQLIARQPELLKRRNLDLRIICITDSKKALFNPSETKSWRTQFENDSQEYTIQDIIEYVKKQGINQVIAVDNSASEELVEDYKNLIGAGFHLVSSNKIANALPWNEYHSLRNLLQNKELNYLYETNVGAGLPLIDSLQLLHLSGENITRIRGVFSGSLSYIFNTFCESNETFSSIIHKAIKKGYTEPDPREDLCGMDVARKLLILARELDLRNNLEDVSVENLVPKEYRRLNLSEFLNQLSGLDVPFEIRKKNLKSDEVLRYVAELKGDLMDEYGGQLSVQLIKVPKASVLGQLKGSDSIFEIYTENYGEHPIVIQGAGAGSVVTARGVFGDILRLSEKI